jgi:hypothetical protein
MARSNQVDLISRCSAGTSRSVSEESSQTGPGQRVRDTHQLDVDLPAFDGQRTNTLAILREPIVERPRRRRIDALDRLTIVPIHELAQPPRQGVRIEALGVVELQVSNCGGEIVRVDRCD